MVSTNTRPTNYKRLRNRCPNCGHRLTLLKGKQHCAQVEGDPKMGENEKLIPCPCDKHYRR